MADELWQAFVQVTGAVNALLLGTILLLSPRLARTRSRHKLGLAMLAYGYLLLSFTAVDNGWVPTSWQVLLADYVIVLTASALFLDYVSGSVGRGSLPRAVYLPPLFFLAAAGLAGPAFILGPAIGAVIVLQFCYTCATTWIYLRASRFLATRANHLRTLLIGLWILHGFQFSRLLLPDVGWLFDMVPLAGTALILAFTALVLTDSRTLRTLSRAVPGPRDHAITHEELERYMQSEQPHLDPRLTLDKLAAALELPPRDLSQLIAASADGKFYSFINRHRVEEARRLLADPRERRTSVDAIGLMAGFRARSTFYEAFRKAFGMTPAQFRRERE